MSTIGIYSQHAYFGHFSGGMQWCSLKYFSIRLHSSCTRASISLVHVWKRDWSHHLFCSVLFPVLWHVCDTEPGSKQEKTNSSSGVSVGPVLIYLHMHSHIVNRITFNLRWSEKDFFFGLLFTLQAASRAWRYFTKNAGGKNNPYLLDYVSN